MLRGATQNNKSYSFGVLQSRRRETFNDPLGT